MRAAKHTPGPWRHEWHENDIEHHILGPQEADGFSEIVGTAMRTDNAALIASAPELLTSLKEVTACLESYVPTTDAEYQFITQAHAAIAKAEGTADATR